MGRRYRAEAILTCDERGNVFAPGYLDVEGDRVAGVGPSRDAPLREDWTETTLPGLVMPGFVNTHCHSPMVLLRGAGEGYALEKWLREVVWPREARLEAEDVYWGMTLAADELLRNGVTTTCEMYFFEDAIAHAAEQVGMRCLVTPGVLVAPGFENRGSWQEQVDAIGEFHARRHGSAGDRVRVGFGPHSAYTIPLEAVAVAAQSARHLDTLVHIHLAETRHEARALEEKYGASAVRILADHGVFDGDAIAAHSVWLDDDDIELYAEKNVAVSHCPQSNAKLASGTARVSDMVGRGVTVSLGTDGPASNNNLDLWEEMRFAALGARAATGDAAALGARTVLEMATRNGGKALAWDGVGELSEGSCADFLHVDLDDPSFHPIVAAEDYLSHVVWSGGSRSVTDVWVGGRHVVKEGRCTTVDAPAVRREVRSRARRLAGR